jgi:hypothetical protein
MGKWARWIAIISSLCLAWAVQAATTKKRSYATRTLNGQATYRTARYARQTNSRKSHAKSRRRSHYSRRRRHYRRRIRLPKAPSRERTTQIQTALARGGYYKGDPDGKWDADTVAAVQKFQSANNIDATGKLDAPTLQKLGLGSDIAGVAAPKPLVPKDCCSTGAPVSMGAEPTNAANSMNPAPAVRAQPGSAASGSSQSPGQANGAAPAAAITPASNSGNRSTADPASVSRQSSSQH